ncbi:efflux RND transporter periplasmic adaptor subunit [Massilia glaciei]|uniref:Efflux RND transporter periplasmic adaptor subunit n=1 Tax=Massilia glaciei TaxID=1524097 RepID=A0A2U2HB13_9BURK|nr:efflux RND transporter periplasmic adaptor subunit [Massilia glaciei]PWF39971.1 efflux RND transporter periplasmic adaptor subunit [Massilia glaciei]
MKPPNKLAIMATAAALAALVLTGCDPATGKTADAAQAGPPVTAAAVIERSINETQEFSGRLEAVERVEIRARVGGFITSVNFKPGGLVPKGDVLFVIDPRPYQAEADRADAAAASARARAELAGLELARSERLLADKAIPQREYDEKASSVKELGANARAAQASHRAAQLNLGYTRVLWPINGRVSKAEFTTGNLIDGAVVLTSVVSNNPIHASFDGDEETYLRVGRLAQKGDVVGVRIGLANEAGFPHEGKLDFVDNRLDADTGSVRLRATFDNADNLLVPGLFARVQLGGGAAARTRVAMINELAVGTDQDRKFVYVVKADGTAEYRPVKLGPAVGGLRVVRDGLKAGENIVANGLQRVRPGAPITVAMVPMVGDGTAPPPTVGVEVAAVAKKTKDQ